MTEIGSGTFYSQETSKTGDFSTWYRDGKFSTPEPMPVYIQKKFLSNFTID